MISDSAHWSISVFMLNVVFVLKCYIKNNLKNACIQMERMTCCLRSKVKIKHSVWKIFNSDIFVSKENDTINTFEEYFICELI